MVNQLTNLIDSTLKQIARDYQLGTLAYTKKTKPVEWGKLLAIEQEINLATKKEDSKALKEALSRYQKLIFSLCKKFKEEATSERET